MMTSKNTYARFAAFYDAYVGGYSQDIPLYLDLAESCRSHILEIGCGSGRILLPLLNAGHQVTGVDISDEMLSLASRKIKKQFPEGDCILLNHNFLNGPLAPEFGLALLTFYTFNYLLTPKEQTVFLKNIAESLLPPSTIVLHLFYPGPLLHPETAGKWIDKGRFRIGNRNILLYDFRHMIDNHIEERLQTFEYESGKREEIRTLRRWVKGDEISELLSSSGFSRPTLVPEFDLSKQAPLIPGQEIPSEFVVKAEKI
ncbi:MAG: class I SAM-dependent methyltransferase [Thermodesulfobacteriota bacterium]